MAGIVVVFDFDKTIIDCDSDNWVVDELGATHVFNQLLPSMQWNELIDRMMSELHAMGKTIDDIAECLKKAPLHPRIICAIKSAYSLGCDLKIVSDANEFFIKTILKHHGLLECFSEIHTNPSFINEEGKLSILPCHASPHGCPTVLCPPNMCKGAIVEEILSSISNEGGGKKRIIYLGDGNGDFCAALKLSEEDFVMPRKKFPLWNVILEHPMKISAKICEWSDGEELEQVLLSLISSVLVNERSSSIDCKTLTSSSPVKEALPKALPVRQ